MERIFAALRWARISACPAGSFPATIRLCARARISPEGPTPTAPTGTSPSFAAFSASPSAARIHRSRSVTPRTGGTAPRSRRGLREQKTVHRLPLAGGKVPVKRPVPQTLVPLGRGKVLPLGQPLPHSMAPFGGELPKVSHELLDGPLLLRPGGSVDLAPLHQEVALSLREFPTTFPPFDDSL